MEPTIELVTPKLIVVEGPPVPDDEIDNPVAGLPVTASEALYGFMSWLTVREEASGPFGAKHCAGEAAELVGAYCEEQGFENPRPGWEKNLKPGPHVAEGKAVGTAMIDREVLARDQAIRLRGAFPSTIRSRMRLSATNALRRLKPVMQEARKKIGALLRSYQRGQLSFDDLQLRSAKLWREAYERVRDVGREASGISRMGVVPELLREEENWFRGAVREELQYWHGFLEDIKSGRAEGRVKFRFESYVKALRFMYESARIVAMPDNVLLYWMGPKKDDPNICDGCVYMMERSPFVKSNIPAVPRDGMTPCLTNCRHRIVVRISESNQSVIRRIAAMPTRESMVRDLQEIKKSAGHRAWQSHGQRAARRADAQARNPFQGSPIRARRTFHESVRERADLFTVRSVGGGVLYAKREGETLFVQDAEFAPTEVAASIVTKHEVGLDLYRQLFDYAMGKKVNVHSDATVEFASAQVWRGLRNEGYPIKEHPLVTEHELPDGGFVLYVKGGGLRTPVFKLDTRRPEGGDYISEQSAGAVPTLIAPHRGLRLYDVVSMLARAVRAPNLDIEKVRNLMSRVTAGLEATILGVEGTGQGLRVNKMLRDALDGLLDRLDIGESIEAELRPLAEDCETRTVCSAIRRALDEVAA